MMTPRSSCPGEESIPLQGPNLRLIYEINNVTDTALGNLAGAALIPARASPIDRLGHSWKAEAGQFWRAPKGNDEHFVTLQYKTPSGDGKYAIFRFDKSGDCREARAAIEATLGMKVER